GIAQVPLRAGLRLEPADVAEPVLPGAVAVRAEPGERDAERSPIAVLGGLRKRFRLRRGRRHEALFEIAGGARHELVQELRAPPSPFAFVALGPRDVQVRARARECDVEEPPL